MNDAPKTQDRSPGDDALEQRARQLFAASIDTLDDASCARLEQSRRNALALLGQRQQATRHRSRWLVGGALAASVLAAALLLRGPVDETAVPTVMQAAPAYDEAAAPPLEVFAAEDEAVIADDPEFYAWVEMDAPDGNGHT